VARSVFKSLSSKNGIVSLISLIAEFDGSFIRSAPVKRYSTDTLRASAMRNASSALGIMLLFFHEEKVPLGIRVFRYSHSKLVCCLSTSFLTIFQKNSAFIMSYYDISMVIYMNLSKFSLDKCMRLKYSTYDYMRLHTFL